MSFTIGGSVHSLQSACCVKSVLGRCRAESALPRHAPTWLFISERQAQLTRQAVNYIIRVAGETAKLGRVWSHMLRHSCGYYLADKGTDLRTMQDYLGHRDPKHTAHYTRVAGHRFKGLWK